MATNNSNTRNNNARRKTGTTGNRSNSGQSQPKRSQAKKNQTRRGKVDYNTYEPLHTKQETIKEFVIWITLVVSIILMLCVLNLCGPLSNILGYFLFGLFGIMAYIFPILIFFSIGFYYMNKSNRHVKVRIISANVLYIILAAIAQMFINGRIDSVFECYTVCAQEHIGGGFIGGLISIGLTKAMGSIATAIILVITAIMLIVFISGRFIASKLYDRGTDVYNDYTVIKQEERRRKIKERDERWEEKREKKRTMYTFPKEDKSALKTDRQGTADTSYASAATDISKTADLPKTAAVSKATKESDMSEKSYESDSGSATFDSDKDVEHISETNESYDDFDNVVIHRPEDNIPVYQKELMSKFGNASSNTSDKSVEKLLQASVGQMLEEDEGSNTFENDYNASDNERNTPVSEGNISEAEYNASLDVSDAFEDVYNTSEHEYGMPPDALETSGEEKAFEDSDNVSENIPYENDTGIVDADPFALSGYLDDSVNKTVSIGGGEPFSKAPLTEDVQNAAGFEKKPSVIVKEENRDSDQKEEVNIEMPYEPIPYIFPDLDLLTKPEKNNDGMTDDELKDMARKLQECLKSFKVDVTMTDIICGPTVTRYELMPALGTRVKKITELENDIKLNLAARDLRIEAPIPGKAAVGIEVPNSSNVIISIREMLESKEFINSKSNLAFAVGKDIGGKTIVGDISKMPHLLIAGSTGSGKSVCINTIVMSIIYKADPNDVKLIMIDPKVVELSVYNGIPHLCIPVVTDPKKAAAALHWAEIEMDRRFETFANYSTRNIEGYNKEVERLKDTEPNLRRMPHIVVIVDELADLMMVASHDVETSICRLAQKARACGIHLIIATQRPSVDVITGLIKANIPSRIAFAVSSQVDSRTILDSQGAEKLLGKGDMLFFPQGLAKPIRVQGAFVSDGEVARVTDFIKEQYDKPAYDESINDKISQVEQSGIGNNSGQLQASDSEDDGRDAYFAEAGRFIIEKQKASIGVLQRVFKIGFNRGARIMDQLAEAGVVSEEDGKKPRNVLMTLEQFEQYLNNK